MDSESEDCCCCCWFWVAGTLLALYFLYRPLSIILYWNRRHSQRKKEVLAERQKDIESTVQKVKGRVSAEKEELIINSTVPQLAKLLKEKKVTSTEMTCAFLYRTATLGVRLNLISELNTDFALKRAEEIDKEISASGFSWEGKNELFGIPVSVKESVNMGGKRYPYGILSFIDRIAERDSEVVKLLKDNGAIPFVTSNVPYLMFTNDTVNPIWGNARNPLNEKRSVSGSSGGEAGLQAGKCSPLGFGSDLLGSLRMPAHFCGIASFKPSGDRVSNRDFKGPYLHQPKFQKFIPAVCGPMARDVSSLRVAMRLFLDKESIERDRNLVPLPWRESRYQEGLKGKIRIGYFSDHELFPVAVACKRPFEEALEIIRQKDKSIELVKFEIPTESYLKIIRSWFCLSMNDGSSREIFTGGLKEFIPHDLFMPSTFCGASTPMKRLLHYISGLVGEKRIKSFTKELVVHNGDSIYEVTRNIRLARKEILSLWKENKLDAVICPGYPTPAFEVGQSTNQNPNAFYLAVHPALNCCAGMLPYGKVREEDTNKEIRKYRDTLEKFSNKGLKGSAGMPTSIHFAGLPNEEENLIGAMERFERLLN